MRKFAEQGYARAQALIGYQLVQGEPSPERAVEGVSWLRKAAAQENGPAQATLARCYETEIGVAQDYAEAAALYSKAGSNGDKQALLKLAGFYERGQGVAVDLRKAKQLRAAADAMPPNPRN